MSETLEVLKALADPIRFKILDLLLAHDLCVGALARRLGISPSAVSQHLQTLRKAGLVKGEKRGYWTHYSVERRALQKIASELAEMAARQDYCQSICSREPERGTKYSEGRKAELCTYCCEHPEKLKGKPGECSPEQIRECHGDVGEHPCEKEKEEK